MLCLCQCQAQVVLARAAAGLQIIELMRLQHAQHVSVCSSCLLALSIDHAAPALARFLPPSCAGLLHELINVKRSGGDLQQQVGSLGMESIM